MNRRLLSLIADPGYGQALPALGRGESERLGAGQHVSIAAAR